ncbi:MAG: SH3 domain-containing protein [Anaerolineae bacterium]|nr:SH3 domain-containing protein [Anaerolineae bacterium]
MKRRRSAAIIPLTLLIVLLALIPTFSVQADFGVNWSAIFFNNPNLTGTGAPLAGINGINFNWGAGPAIVNGVIVPITNCTGPDGSTSADCSNHFSARFTSTQNLAAGNYTFTVSSDDGVRMFINGAVVLDKFIGRPLTTDTFTYTVTTSPVNMTVEYYEGIDQASVQVQWFPAGGAVTPIGTQLFLTPAPVVTAVPPLTVSVVSVKGLSIRTGPYLGASLIGVLRPGTEYPPIARNKDEGTYTWYLINTGTKTGWVSGRYLQVTGDPNAIPLQSTVFEQIDGAADTGALAVPRSVMNLRRRPSQRSTLLAQVPWGAEMPLLGRTIQSGQNFWLQVRYEGQVGWIYAPYVSIRGDVNAVPIR